MLSGLVLAAIAVGVDLTVRHAVRESVWRDALTLAQRVSATLQRDGPPRQLTGTARIPLIQVVDARGVVLQASPAAVKLSRLSAARPASVDNVVKLTTCPEGGRVCLLVDAIRVSAAPDSAVIYAGRPEPAIVRSHVFDVVLGLIAAALTALAALATWYMVGNTLRPMSAIQGELADITISDLSRRVPQPSGQNEIAQLARTVNETLDRLEYSVEQQRQFSSDASHELRTPITGLRSQLEAALLYPDDTDVPAALRAMLHDTERLEQIIADLLLLARLGTSGAVVRESIDVAELVDAEVRHRTSLIRTALTPGLVVIGVRMQLIRLLTNLLDNAERHREKAIDVEAYRDREQAVLTVTDDGPGIAPEDRDRVFDRFTRLDAARSRDAGGVGLGLPIAHNIALAHGGGLTIEDSPRGARFVVRLPLAPPE